MIESIPTDSPKIIGFKMSGKLHDEDYKTFVPEIEARMAGQTPVRLFAQLEDFHGWDMHSAWDDFKFGMKHYSDFERIAMVGDRKWEEWIVKIWKPFSKAKVKYFDASEVDDAWTWLKEAEEAQLQSV